MQIFYLAIFDFDPERLNRWEHHKDKN